MLRPSVACVQLVQETMQPGFYSSAQPGAILIDVQAARGRQDCVPIAVKLTAAPRQEAAIGQRFGEAARQRRLLERRRIDLVHLQRVFWHLVGTKAPALILQANSLLHSTFEFSEACSASWMEGVDAGVVPAHHIRPTIPFLDVEQTYP
jgi:hypothetical protein